MLDFISDWVSQKFVEPLCHYYTLEATLVYGLILAGAAFLIYKLLRQSGFRIDKNFFIALIPFIIYGGWTRALRDHGLYEGWIFCSPPIYFFIFLLTVASLFVSLEYQKQYGIKYSKTMSIIGWVFVMYNITLTNLSNMHALGLIIMLMGFWGVVFFGLNNKWPKLISKVNAGIICAHLLDASSSFISILMFGYCEQHVLTGVLMGAYCNASTLPSFLQLPFMPWMIFPLKIIFVGGALRMLDKHSKDKQFNNFLKIIILILGLALGIRGMLTVSMLVI
jgi:uncharacterized membrane protein